MCIQPTTTLARRARNTPKPTILVFLTSSRRVQLHRSSTLAALARRHLREGVIWLGMVRRLTKTNRTSMLTLIERIHSGIKPHACDFPKCGKRFIQRSALNVHIRVHTGVKPHVCERCDKVAFCMIEMPPLTDIWIAIQRFQLIGTSSTHTLRQTTIHLPLSQLRQDLHQTDSPDEASNSS
jgi:hypothetical protein